MYQRTIGAKAANGFDLDDGGRCGFERGADCSREGVRKLHALLQGLQRGRARQGRRQVVLALQARPGLHDPRQSAGASARRSIVSGKPCRRCPCNGSRISRRWCSPCIPGPTTSMSWSIPACHRPGPGSLITASCARCRRPTWRKAILWWCWSMSWRRSSCPTRMCRSAVLKPEQVVSVTLEARPQWRRLRGQDLQPAHNSRRADPGNGVSVSPSREGDGLGVAAAKPRPVLEVASRCCARPAAKRSGLGLNTCRDRLFRPHPALHPQFDFGKLVTDQGHTFVQGAALFNIRAPTA